MIRLDASPADWYALAVFTFCVVGYSIYSDKSSHPKMLNARMRGVRRAWVRRMLEREDRVTDTILTGHSANAISFFASATILVLAALIGVVAKTKDFHLLTNGLLLVEPTSLAMFQFKIFGLIGIFVFGFYRFTWSLLQASYYFALVGAAPTSQAAPSEDLDDYAEKISHVLNSVFTNYNGGIRTYYYALAWLGWLFQPAIFVATTGFITAILVLRQFRSTSALAIVAFAQRIDSQSTDSRRVR